MGQRMKLGGKWRALDLFLKVRGVWKAAESVYVKVNGVWRLGHHIHDFIYVSNGAESTHTATCAHCNKTITEGHVYFLTGKKDATCTEDGYEIFLCNKCSQERTIVLKTPGHDWEDVVITEASCLDKGEVVETCARCGATGKTNYPDALGHVYDYENSPYENATCDAPGGWTHTCERCGNTWFDRDGDPLGHYYTQTGSWKDGDGNIVVEYTCRNCGDTYSETWNESGEPV